VLLDVGDFAVTDVDLVDRVLVEGSAVVAARCGTATATVSQPNP
jgi:hypothetical protein